MGSINPQCFLLQSQYPNLVHTILTFEQRQHASFIFKKLQRPSKVRFSRFDESMREITSFPYHNLPAQVSSQNEKRSIDFVAKKTLVYLIGTFFFMGSIGIGARNSAALPSERNKKTETIDSRAGNSERLDLMEMLLENEPRNLVALKALLQDNVRRGKLDEAIEYAKRLMREEPDEVEWLLMQAFCHESMGNLDDAKKAFKEILQEKPLLHRALHGLAMVMQKNGESTAMFDMLNKAAATARKEKKVTEERSIKIIIAKMNIATGQLDESITVLDSLIKENPRDFRPYLFKGIVFSLMDRKTESDECFNTYKSFVPDEFPQKSFIEDVILFAKNKQFSEQENLMM